MCVYVGELNLPGFYLLSQPVVLDVKMFCPLCQARISCYLDASLRIVVQCDTVVILKSLEVTSQSLEVEGLFRCFEGCLSGLHELSIY